MENALARAAAGVGSAAWAACVETTGPGGGGGAAEIAADCAATVAGEGDAVCSLGRPHHLGRDGPSSTFNGTEPRPCALTRLYTTLPGSDSIGLPVPKALLLPSGTAVKADDEAVEAAAGVAVRPAAAEAAAAVDGRVVDGRSCREDEEDGNVSTSAAVVNGTVSLRMERPSVAVAASLEGRPVLVGLAICTGASTTGSPSKEDDELCAARGALRAPIGDAAEPTLVREDSCTASLGPPV